MTRFGPVSDPVAFAVRLCSLLDRVLPDLADASSLQLLVTQFLDGLPPAMVDQLRIVNTTQGAGVVELAVVAGEYRSQRQHCELKTEKIASDWTGERNVGAD